MNQPDVDPGPLGTEEIGPSFVVVEWGFVVIAWAAVLVLLAILVLR